jgi:hypothetical protein
VLLVPPHQLGERLRELRPHRLEQPFERRGVGLRQAEIHRLPHDQPQRDLDDVKIVMLRFYRQPLRQHGGVVDQQVVGDAIGMAALQHHRPGGAEARPDDHDPLWPGVADPQLGRAAKLAVADRSNRRSRRLNSRRRQAGAIGADRRLERLGRRHLVGKAVGELGPDADRADRLAPFGGEPGHAIGWPERGRKFRGGIAKPLLRFGPMAESGQRIGRLDPGRPEIRKGGAQLLGPAEGFAPVAPAVRRHDMVVGEPALVGEVRDRLGENLVGPLVQPGFVTGLAGLQPMVRLRRLGGAQRFPQLGGARPIPGGARGLCRCQPRRPGTLLIRLKTGRRKVHCKHFRQKCRSPACSRRISSGPGKAGMTLVSTRSALGRGLWLLRRNLSSLPPAGACRNP